jgi:hypothetical protein
MFNTPDGARCDALKATYSEVDALLKAELRKANPGLDDAEIFWLAAEAQFPGVIDRVIERFGALGYSLTAGPPAPTPPGLPPGEIALVGEAFSADARRRPRSAGLPRPCTGLLGIE